MSQMDTGPITDDEAREIAHRFNASHWNRSDHEKARYTIPADPRRDDDIRLLAYIDQSAALRASLATVTAWKEAVREALGDHPDIDLESPDAIRQRISDIRDEGRAHFHSLATVTAERDAARRMCNRWLGAVMARYPVNIEMDPINPEVMVGNLLDFSALDAHRAKETRT